MKKTLLSLFMLTALSAANAQNVFSYGFDGTTESLDAAGWIRTNQSTPATTTLWTNADYEGPLENPIFGSDSPVGHAGGTNSFALVNYTSTGTINPVTGAASGSGNISNWLITPVITVQNGDIVSFYTRKGTDGTEDYPDRLELRMSSATTHTTPTGGATNVGSFTTVGVTVNPTLVSGFVYPKTWTQYTFTVSGLAAPTAVKFAFRYFVNNGGAAGANSDIIGIDTFSVDRTLSTNDFFASNFAVYPNPSNGLVNLASKNNMAINAIQITDLNGRVVRNINTNGVSETQINISDLTTGLYFLNVQTDSGSGTTKIVKN
ncbi:T9SS type A sorting domain-containing protein [Flavobacterium sp. WW92]|uniref:T9SS-dependent choice-of-anchor J family protein n=1 Tax=unclassified Flavobacterium TaxID=196869 RepID=UPI0022251538|nr:MULTISPECIES: T9SS type A sorting domain-containing protein [unclassified Flavobacterium]WDO14241.1 T9SS type A sorting domain-containing protein [Flavobacterium sp. WW92]